MPFRLTRAEMYQIQISEYLSISEHLSITNRQVSWQMQHMLQSESGTSLLTAHVTCAILNVEYREAQFTVIVCVTSTHYLWTLKRTICLEAAVEDKFVIPLFSRFRTSIWFCGDLQYVLLFLRSGWSHSWAICKVSGFFVLGFGMICLETQRFFCVRGDGGDPWRVGVFPTV